MDHESTDPHPFAGCAPLHNLHAHMLTLAFFIRSVAPCPLTSCTHTDMKESEKNRLENVVLARPARNAITALRSQFKSESPIDAEFAPTTPRNAHPNDVELDIRVCVERTVMVDYTNESENESSCGRPAKE